MKWCVLGDKEPKVYERHNLMMDSCMREIVLSCERIVNEESRKY